MHHQNPINQHHLDHTCTLSRIQNDELQCQCTEFRHFKKCPPLPTEIIIDPLKENSYTGWRRFVHQYNAKIGLNANLTPFQKNAYLRAALPEDARQAVEIVDPYLNSLAATIHELGRHYSYKRTSQSALFYQLLHMQPTQNTEDALKAANHFYKLCHLLKEDGAPMRMTLYLEVFHRILPENLCILLEIQRNYKDMRHREVTEFVRWAIDIIRDLHDVRHPRMFHPPQAPPNHTHTPAPTQRTIQSPPCPKFSQLPQYHHHPHRRRYERRATQTYARQPPKHPVTHSNKPTEHTPHVHTPPTPEAHTQTQTAQSHQKPQTLSKPNTTTTSNSGHTLTTRTVKPRTMQTSEILPAPIRDTHIPIVLALQSTHTMVKTPEQAMYDRMVDIQHLGITEADFHTTEEEQVLRQFHASLRRDETGRYQAQYPVNHNLSKLDSQLPIAITRLRSTQNKMQTDPEFRKALEETLQYQQKAGIIKEIQFKDPLPKGSVAPHYLPYHAVRKESSTTAVRIVYDPTPVSKQSGLSLNDCLHKGIPDMPSLYGIMLRVRCFPILTICDVEKAFHQVGIQPQHRAMCRFLLPKDPNRTLSPDNLRVFEFQRLAFGLKPAPFMLQEVVKAHFKNSESTLGEDMLKNLYVDNVNISASTYAEAVSKSLEAVRVLAEAQMNLREFISNAPLNLPPSLKGDHTKAKILGHRWEPFTDKMTIKLPPVTNTARWTRALILGLFQTPFDPLGLLTPLFIPFKRFFQSLWKFPQYGWNDPLPTEIVVQWLEIASNWKQQEFTFPRRTHLEDGDEIHIFSDASSYAYGAVAYGVSTKNRKKGGQLLSSKGLIIPMKKRLPHKHLRPVEQHKVKPTRTDEPMFTIPQAETASAKTACTLAHTLLKELGLKLKVYYWGDSRITLSWIQQGAAHQPLAVRNMLQKIWDSPVQHFGHVTTDQNPADLVSRGLHPEDLAKSDIWFQGPPFLKHEPDQWKSAMRFHLPSEPIHTHPPPTPLPVVLTTVSAQNSTVSHPLARILQLPSLKMAHNAVILVLKFINRLKHRATSANTPLLSNTQIRHRAHISIHQADQTIHPPTAEQVAKLNLIKDPEGIFRSMGRIGKSQLPEHTKNPIFIQPHSPLARLTLIQAHTRMCHQGPRATICWSRKFHWIPKGMRTAATVIKQCPQCLEFRRKPFDAPPPDALPAERIRKAKPFQKIGIDAFGPFPVQTEAGIRRRWGIIFSCMVTRAIHLEVLEDYSSPAFLRAFQRFVAVRSVPDLIISDHGSNFTGAADLILDHYSLHTPLNWRFNFPRCPWKGGFYERQIGIVKNAFKRSTLSKRKLTDAEFHTILKEIENAVNHRPLFQPSDIRGEYTCLRPIDFLLPSGSSYHPPSPYTDDYDDDPSYIPAEALRRKKAERRLDENPLSQVFYRLQAILDTLWRGWAEEYLTELRKHEKGPKNPESGRKTPNIGEAVIVEDDFLTRGTRNVGIVEQILPPAGHTRPITALVRIRDLSVKDVTSNNAFITRTLPIQMLYPLEMDVTDDTPDPTHGTYPYSPQPTINTPRPISQPNKPTNPSEHTPTQTPGHPRPQRNVPTRNYAHMINSLDDIVLCTTAHSEIISWETPNRQNKMMTKPHHTTIKAAELRTNVSFADPAPPEKVPRKMDEASEPPPTQSSGTQPATTPATQPTSNVSTATNPTSSKSRSSLARSMSPTSSRSHSVKRTHPKQHQAQNPDNTESDRSGSDPEPSAPLKKLPPRNPTRQHHDSPESKALAAGYASHSRQPDPSRKILILTPRPSHAVPDTRPFGTKSLGLENPPHFAPQENTFKNRVQLIPLSRRHPLSPTYVCDPSKPHHNQCTRAIPITYAPHNIPHNWHVTSPAAAMLLAHIDADPGNSLNTERINQLLQASPRKTIELYVAWFRRPPPQDPRVVETTIVVVDSCRRRSEAIRKYQMVDIEMDPRRGEDNHFMGEYQKVINQIRRHVNTPLPPFSLHPIQILEHQIVISSCNPEWAVLTPQVNSARNPNYTHSRMVTFRLEQISDFVREVELGITYLTQRVMIILITTQSRELEETPVERIVQAFQPYARMIGHDFRLLLAVQYETVAHWRGKEEEMDQLMTTHPYLEIRASLNDLHPKQVAPQITKEILELWRKMDRRRRYNTQPSIGHAEDLDPEETPRQHQV